MLAVRAGGGHAGSYLGDGRSSVPIVAAAPDRRKPGSGVLPIRNPDRQIAIGAKSQAGVPILRRCRKSALPFRGAPGVWRRWPISTGVA